MEVFLCMKRSIQTKRTLSIKPILILKVLYLLKNYSTDCMLQPESVTQPETPLSIILAHSATERPPLFTAICDTGLAANAVLAGDSIDKHRAAIAINFFIEVTSRFDVLF
jgi:hypothetical protein